MDNSVQTSPPGTFSIARSDGTSKARCGVLHTAHGPVETPAFMPVGTRATVKSLDCRDLRELGASVILGNTYHLVLRPGMDVMEKCGGLHRFMSWDGPILTDSGGFQVFSLARIRKLTPEGCFFHSHIDGAEVFLGPKESMEAQRILGSDIAMVFDECLPWPCGEERARKSVATTLRWAEESLAAPHAPGQLVFGIVQGGIYDGLRASCAAELAGMTDGEIARYRETHPGEIAPEWYDFDGHPIPVLLETAPDDGGLPTCRKNTVAGSAFLDLDRLPRSSFSLTAASDGKTPAQTFRINASGADFSSVDFSAFSFSPCGAGTAVFREKCRLWYRKRYRIRSEEFDSPISVRAVLYRAEEAGKVKEP